MQNFEINVTFVERSKKALFFKFIRKSIFGLELRHETG